MSDFSAKFQAILDTSKIPSQIAAVEKTPVTLRNITLDTKNLPSQIQASLDSHRFTIKLDGIKMENINSQASKAGQGYSKSFADGVRTQLSNGGIEASIARVTSQYEKLANTGHGYLSKITTDIQTLNRLHSELDLKKGSDKALIKTYRSFNEVLTNVKNNLITVSAQTKAVASQSQIDALGNKMSAWSLNNTKASALFGASIANLQSRLKALGSNVPISELNKLSAEFERIKLQASAAGMTGNSFAESIRRSFRNISSYISIATIIRQSVNTLKQMAKNTLAVDTAMTGLYRITKMTNAEYRNLYKDMASSAKKYGAELTSIIDATTNWTKLGFDTGISKQLAEITTMYQQVTDLDTNTAVNNLITAYKGFEKQLLQLTGGDTVAAVEYVADIFDKLGNEFAVKASDIGAALVNSASTLNMAGNTIQQTAGMVTGIVEVTQDASRAGTALRTLTMRLSGTTAEELSAMGEDVDGLVEVTSKLQDTIKGQTGVNIVDSNGQLRSTYEIMRDLAAVWEDLDRNTQANVLETIAGKNRSSDVAALLNNWSSVEKAVKAATEATGTARKEYAVFLESLQAHLNRLKASWQELSYSFMDVGLLKGGVDILVKLLNTLNSVVTTFGGLGSIGIGTAIFGVVKNFGKIQTMISKIMNASTAFYDLYDAASYAGNGLKSFMKTPLGVATAIGLVVAALGALIQAQKRAREEQEQFAASAVEKANSDKESVKQLDELIDRYKKVSESVMEDADKRSEIVDIQTQINELVGNQASGIDLVNGALDAELAKLYEIRKEAANQAIQSSISAYHSKREVSDSAIAEDTYMLVPGYAYTGRREEAAEEILRNAGYKNFSASGPFNNTLVIQDTYDQNWNELKGAIEKAKYLQGMIDVLESQYSDYASSDLYNGLIKQRDAYLVYANDVSDAASLLLDSVINYAYAYDSGLNNITIDSADSFETFLNEFVDTVSNSGDITEALKNGDITEESIRTGILQYLSTIPSISEFYNEYISEQQEQIDTTANKITFSFPKLIEDTDSENDYIDQINDYVEKVEFLKKKLEMARDGSLFEPENTTDLAEMYELFPSIATFDDVESGIIDAINSLWRTVDEETGEMTGGLDKVFTDMFKNMDISDPANTLAYLKFTSALSSLFETAEEGTPIFEDLSDAISGVGGASDLISTIQEEMADSGQITLDTLGKMAKEFGSDIGNYFTIDSDGKIIAKVDDIKSYYINAIKEMELEDKALEKSLIDALDNGFNEADYNFESLTNAMSKAQEVASIAANAQKEISYDTVESLRSIFGQDFENYIITDEAGNYIAANVEELRNYARGLLEAGNASDATLAQFDSMWQSTLDGTKEAETALDRLSKALSNVNDVSSYLTLLQSDDLTFVDALEQAVKLLESMGDGYSLDDFFAFGDDGSITYKTEALTDWINSYIDSMVTAGDVSKELADQMKAAAKAEIEQVNAIEKLTDAMSKVEKASDIIGKAQEEIKENGKNSLETVMSLYEQFGEKANTMFTPSGDGGFIINTDLIKQELYKLIDDVEAATPEIKQAMKDALDVQLEEEEFNDVVDEYVSKVQTLKEALETLRSDGNLSDSALYDLVKEFPELATQTDNLGEAITNLIGTMNTDMISKFNDQFGKIDSEEDRKELEAFMEIVLKLGEVVGETQFAIDINAEVEGMQNLFDAMKESVSATGLTAQSVTNLKQRYQELDSYDPAKLFERTENGIHLNTKALRELESEYETIAKGKISETYDELIQQYKDLTEEIDRVGTTASTVDLYAQRDKILQQINETAELAAQYAGLTSNFHKWEEAQSIGEEGDMYDSLTGSLKEIKQLYQDGLIGTNKFRTAVQLMSNEDLSNATADELIAAYEAGYPKMERYFKDSSKGVSNFLKDVEKLNSEWAHQNEDGSWEIDFGVGGDQEIADALGINVEAVQAIMRKLSDYGFDINLDTMYSSFETMQSKAEKAASKLKELGATDVDFNFNATNIERVDEQIKYAKETLEQFKDKDGKIDLSVEGAQEAQYVLATLILQKQALEQPAILQVDAGNVDGTVGETLRKLQKFKQEYNNLQVQAAIGADVTGLESSINSTLSSFTPDEIEILGKLGIDTNATTEEINTAIAGITPEMLVSIGVDESAVTAFAGQNHDTTATVVYNVDGSKVSRYNPPRKSSTVKYTAYLESWTPPDKYGTVYYTAKMRSSGSTTGGTTGNKPKIAATGTAYAGGTSGDWGTKGSGTALGGELGTEIVVLRCYTAWQQAEQIIYLIAGNPLEPFGYSVRMKYA